MDGGTGNRGVGLEMDEGFSRRQDGMDMARFLSIYGSLNEYTPCSVRIA
jgi:hypothetical protein